MKNILFYRIKPFESNKKLNKFSLALFSILGVVILAQLIVSNILAGRGQELGKLEKRKEELSQENANLREDLSSKTSLSSIAKRAEKLEFVKSDNILYVAISKDSTALAQ